MPEPVLNPAIRVDGVSLTFGGATPVQALDDVSLRVEPGQFVSLVGPSGCGKSTLLKLLAGLVLPDAGSASIEGVPVAGRPGSAAFMPQRDLLMPWRTILDKRENFRAAFDNFDVDCMSNYDADKGEALLQNAGIIRHRGKIEAVINNAARAREVIAEFGSLAAYIWSYEPPEDEIPVPQSMTTSPASHALSKDMKKRGWKFVGPTTIFAFMQSMGLINDHAEGCSIRTEVDAARRGFARPLP